MKRRIVSFVLVLCMVLSVLPVQVWAAEIVASGTCGADGDNLTWTLDNAGVLTISGEGAMWGSQPWGEYVSEIKEAVIGGGVTNIGDGAFTYCDNLESVTIPESVTGIGYAAFEGCSSLTSVTIPEGVTSIGDWAFGNCYNLENMTIPNSVTSIGGSAFYDCDNLESVTIPNSVTSIGGCAFAYCDNLQSVTIPEGVTGIAPHTFYYCENLESVTVPSSVISIDGYAFARCLKLANVTIPESVISIGDFAFENCDNLRNVTIPDGVISIGDSAFDGCGSLTGVTIPSSVTIIGESAFDYCYLLTDVYYGGTAENWAALENRPSVSRVHYECLDPENHWVLQEKEATCTEGGYSWEGCLCGYERNKNYTASARGHNFVDAVCTICGEISMINAQVLLLYLGTDNQYAENYIETQVPADSTYQDLYDLLQFPAEDAHSAALGNLTGWKMYYDGESLSDTVVPDSYSEEPTTHLSVYAVYEYDKFIYTAHYADEQGVMISHDESTRIPVGTTQSQFLNKQVALPNCGCEFSHWHILGAGDAYYRESSAYACYDGLMPLNISVIYRNEYGEEDYASTYIYVTGTPDTLVEEDVKNAIIQAIQSMDDLCPDGKVISGYVWDDLGLTHTVFQDIDYGESCTGLWANVTLEYEDDPIVASGTCGADGDNLTWTLDNAGVLTIFGEGEMETYQLGYAPWFTNHTSMTKLVLEDGVTTISPFAFAYCNKLMSVTIPDSVTSIGGSSFWACKGLTSLTIPDSVTSIGNSAFRGCSGLLSVIIPDSVISIGSSAFVDCSGLLSVIIPDSVTSIGYSAFENCSGLTSVDISNSVTSFDSYTFGGCSGLTSVDIPESVTSIGIGAFKNCSGLTSVDIPESVTSIDNSAFEGCTRLIRIVFDGNVPKIKTNTFSSVIATAYYPCGNGTWTADKLQNYGGTITWKVQHGEEMFVPGKAATCTETGLTEGKHCTVCGMITVLQKEVPMKDHSYVDGACTVCGVEDPDYIAPLTGVTRIFGADRYETAFKTAEVLKQQLGVEKFNSIVVACGDNFADALGGSYLAAKKNAPILLVKSSKIDAVKSYIKANLNPGGTVYLLGGTAAIPAAMDKGLDGFTVRRLAGATRYDTNLLILQEAGVTNEDILICTGKNFADSLSAAAAGRPILLVKDSLNDSQKAFLQSHAANKKYILGGTAAVSTSVENQAKAYGTVERIGGNTRYETSVLIAKEFFPNAKQAALAYAQNFPDGLSGGALAYAMKAPLVLTASGKEAAAASYAKERGITSGVILGGNVLISDKAARTIFQMKSGDVIKIG